MSDITLSSLIDNKYLLTAPLANTRA
jgi:hypothetical protein